MDTNEIRFCAVCGNKLTPGDQFCRKCGAKVGTAQPAQGVYQQPVYNQYPQFTPAIPTNRNISIALCVIGLSLGWLIPLVGYICCGLAISRERKNAKLGQPDKLLFVLSVEVLFYLPFLIFTALLYSDPRLCNLYTKKPSAL